MRLSIAAAFVGMSLLLGGCASGPAYKDAMASAKGVPAGQGRIYFYRPSSMGAAVQPKVKLNGQEVGVAKSKGFFYVDRAPGEYKVSTTTEVEKDLTFLLGPAETKYVKLNIAMGFMVGHVYPTLAEAAEGQKDLEKMKYTGGQ
jgi:hypothetical protein